MFQLNGQPIDITLDLTIGVGDDAITYPAAELTKPEVRQALGIVDVIFDPRPDDRFFWVDDNGDGTYSTEVKSIEMLKATKSAEIAAARYAAEIAGFTLPSGAVIRTDRESQSLVASALIRLQRNPGGQIDWKGENGWVKIGLEEVETIADAVGNHVQSCFSAERVKQEALDALTDPLDIIAFDCAVGV